MVTVYIGTYQLGMLLNVAFALPIDYGFITETEMPEETGERNLNLT